MVHADASNFKGFTKSQIFQQVLDEAEALFDGQRNWVCNLANTASLLWHAYLALPKPKNWTGFYVLDPKNEQQLILGPFHGKVACQTIRFGKGVCGAAAQMAKTVRVEDVEAFPGHIACDSVSKSEIVVPILTKAGKVVAIIDIDCTELDGFDDEDQTFLENLAKILASSCDW